jgi:Fungal Zn(2)-Cys(6) binuclear cluster domain
VVSPLPHEPRFAPKFSEPSRTEPNRHIRISPKWSNSPILRTFYTRCLQVSACFFCLPTSSTLPAPMSSSGYEPLEPPRPRLKRMRPRHACNLCRARKVRCDPGDNSCSNCELAGVDCVTTDPKSGASRILDRRRGQSAGIQRPSGSFAALRPMSPASSGSPSDLSKDGISVESNLARRLSQMEQRLLLLDRQRGEGQNSSLPVQWDRVRAHNPSGPPLNPLQRSLFHSMDTRVQSQTNLSSEITGSCAHFVLPDISPLLQISTSLRG